MSDSIEDKNKDWGYNIRKSMVCDPEVSIPARLLYVILRSHLGPENNTAWPSLRRLSGFMGCHRESVQKYLNELVAIKWITKKDQRKKNEGKFLSTRYILNKD